MADKDKKGFGWSGLIGSVLSSVASMVTTHMTNEANKKITQQQNEFNAEQAQISRDFSHQEAIDNYQRNLQADSTKYQRSVNDMTAAGLNPALMMSGGTAISAPVMSSTAQTATAQGGSGIPMQNPMDLSSIAQIITAGAQADLMKKQGNKIDLEAEAQAITNRYLDDKTRLEISNLLEDAGRKGAEKELALANAAVVKAKLPFVSDKEAAELAGKLLDNDLHAADLDSYDWNHAKTLTYSDAISAAKSKGYHVNDMTGYNDGVEGSTSRSWGAGIGAGAKGLSGSLSVNRSKSDSFGKQHGETESHGKGETESSSHSKSASRQVIVVWDHKNKACYIMDYNGDIPAATVTE